MKLIIITHLNLDKNLKMIYNLNDIFHAQEKENTNVIAHEIELFSLQVSQISFARENVLLFDSYL